MSRHIGRNERWKKIEGFEEYTSDFGIVMKDTTNGCKTWVALVKDGFGHTVCGRGFKRSRNAMIVVEQAAANKKNFLPPIHFQANIFLT